MIIKILDSAEIDLETGFYFYDKQALNLGSYFLDSLYSDIDSLQYYAGSHNIIFGYYRLLSKRFPFAIYYKILNDEILVYAVLDYRQKPSWIRTKLTNNE